MVIGQALRVTRRHDVCVLDWWAVIPSCWTPCEARSLRADHVGDDALVSVPRLDHSVGRTHSFAA